MRKRLKVAALAAACTVAAQAQADPLSFDLSGLTDAFFGGGVTGGFDFDPEDGTFGNVDIAGISATYGAGSGVFLPGAEVAGFGLFDDGLFRFSSGDVTLQFSLTGFDVAASGLAAGETRTLDGIIGAEGVFDADFQLVDPFAPSSAVLTGAVEVTRRADDVVAPIPLPAGLPMLLAGLAGLAAVRRRA